MLTQITAALKHSLNECNKYEHPVDYIYQLNQVLNRFKTNLFKMMPNKDKYLYDGKEFIQLRLHLNWRTDPTYKGEVTIKERQPIMLHISGFSAESGLRNNRESIYSAGVDVSDIIDLEKIANIKTDYHLNNSYERDIIRRHTGDLGDISIYHDRDFELDGIKSFTVVISGMVYERENIDYRAIVTAKDLDKGTRKKRKSSMPNNYMESCPQTEPKLFG